MPCAGLGSRFTKAGYTFPKPLIPIQNLNGEPMIKVVSNNLNLKGNYIFIFQKEHEEKYHINSVIKQTHVDSKIILIDYLTEGSACTCLLAKKYINNDHPLIIADCDHYPIWNSQDFIDHITKHDVDGATLVFPNSHPKFSYCKLENDMFVKEIREKEVISPWANVGVYYWLRGSDFVKYASEMILQNDRVNNEFYSAPVFNKAIKDGKKIIAYKIEKQWELGTPEDLTYFQNHYK